MKEGKKERCIFDKPVIKTEVPKNCKHDMKSNQITIFFSLNLASHYRVSYFNCDYRFNNLSIYQVNICCYLFYEFF